MSPRRWGPLFPAKPTHVEVKVPLTIGPIPDLGGGISLVQFQIAVGWNDSPLALRLSAPMSVLDTNGEVEIAASGSPRVNPRRSADKLSGMSLAPTLSALA